MCTREVGLLRAVGMTRRQLRSTIRGEAIIIALFGFTLGGFVAWAPARRAAHLDVLDALATT